MPSIRLLRFFCSSGESASRRDIAQNWNWSTVLLRRGRRGAPDIGGLADYLVVLSGEPHVEAGLEVGIFMRATARWSDEYDAVSYLRCQLLGGIGGEKRYARRMSWSDGLIWDQRMIPHFQKKFLGTFAATTFGRLLYPNSITKRHERKRSLFRFTFTGRMTQSQTWCCFLTPKWLKGFMQV